MSLKNHFREDMNIPSGTIPYGDHISLDSCVYSIDKFRPRFRLKWGGLNPRIADKEVSLSDDVVIDIVRDRILQPAGFLNPMPYRGGRNVASWNFEGILVFIHSFRAFHYDQPFYSVLIEFNPNKLQRWDIVDALISNLKALLGDFFCWDDTRTDFTFDVPYPIADVRLLSRKQGSCYLGTYYFGKRGVSGYTRIYDKRQEMRDHYPLEIGQEWTRIEYESRGGYPVNYDPPFLIGDLGNHEVLRYVPMDAWPAALRTFDPKTAKKIKRDALRRLTFDPANFQILYDRLLKRLQLPAPYNVEFRRREEDLLHLNENEISRIDEFLELEQLSAQLRKFATDID